MRFFNPTPEQEAEWIAWTKERPECIREVAARFSPWELYLLKTSGHRVFIGSFEEQADGTVTLTVNVTGDFNLVAFERSVFGIKPEDLEPCELPSSGEMLGSMGMSIEDVKDAMAKAKRES